MALIGKDALGVNQALPLYIDPTYSVTGSITAAQTATPTDIIQFAGAATVIARVKRIQIVVRSGSAASTAATLIKLVRRSTAAAGGTPVTPTIGKHDTNDAAAACVVTHFTAFPTAGALVANLRDFGAVTIAGTAIDNTNQVITWDFTTRGDKPLVVRGALDFLCVTLAVALSTAQTLHYEIEWEEALLVNL